MDEQSWAETEFGDCELGDTRRSLRAVKVAAKMAKASDSSLPGALGSLADLKGAYRLFASNEVTHETLLEPHVERTRSRCRDTGHYLLIEDSTIIDLTHRPDLPGSGRIGDDGGHGFHLHTALAVQYFAEEDRGETLGLFDQRRWVRQSPARKGWEKKRDRLARTRESEKWAAFEGDVDAPPEGVRWTYVADRESDVYEVFRCLQGVCDFVIRASQPRALDEEAGSVFSAAGEAPVLGRFSMKLRARPGQAARTARLEVRARRVVLRPPWRPGEKLPLLEPVNAVEVRETGNPGKGVKPLHWLLLTTHRAETFEDAMLVVKIYRKRWLVEEYHKGLKTGTKIEESQLSTVGKIDALLGIYAVLAVRLLALKNRRESGRPLVPEDEELIILRILEARGLAPKGEWTEREYIRAVAKVGGFLGRKSDGDPGWQTIWRGMLQLLAMAQGFTLAMEMKKCG